MTTGTVTYGSGKVPGHRVHADDPLPTQAVVHRVKALSWAACCDKAWGLGWPVDEATLGLIRMAPALLALVELCPEVDAPRLARCLRLDPLTAFWAALDACNSGWWAKEAASGIAHGVRAEIKGRG